MSFSDPPPIAEVGEVGGHRSIGHMAAVDHHQVALDPVRASARDVRSVPTRSSSPPRHGTGITRDPRIRSAALDHHVVEGRAAAGLERGYEHPLPTSLVDLREGVDDSRELGFGEESVEPWAPVDSALVMRPGTHVRRILNFGVGILRASAMDLVVSTVRA